MNSKLRYLILSAMVCLPSLHGFAQRGTNWCFGDSAGLNFSVPTSPTFFTNSVVSRGTAVSISDINSALLMYAFARGGGGGTTKTGRIHNKFNQLMVNGDSIAGTGWYHEMVILPDPADDSLFYLFSIGVSFDYGLKYSKIDLRGDNGLGEVVQKNVSLVDSMFIMDGITAIKHGNGRDWWLICRPYVNPGPVYWNSWYTYLITPSGISQQFIQNVGSLNTNGFGRICVNKEGSKLCFVNTISMIELYDFDRCTGTISNPVNIEQQDINGVYQFYWTCQFSPSGRYLYVGSNALTSKLYQFDTWAPAIDSTKTLLWQTSFPKFTMGDLKLAPDNKIYLSMCYVDTFGTYFPYLPTMYNSYNMNLSVINSPDSAGLACDFQPWSFYLGGKRTYWGLPNNPDYDLPALAGSPCDTLVGVTEAPEISQTVLNVFYHRAWEKAFINASNLKGKTGKLLVYDMQRKVVHSEPLRIQNGYYTRDLSMAGYAKGMYLVTIETGEERLTKKLIK
jgi:hypothetical protein